MPAATVTVLYPAGADATFNVDYYLSTHMPLADKIWSPLGLKSWKVLKFGADAPYSIQATLEFDTVEDFQNAIKNEATGKVLADVPNFSNKDPIIIMGENIGSS